MVCAAQVLPTMADTELPQAVALGTKVHSCAVPGWPAKFAGALRDRVHASATHPAGSAALDSVRLGLVLDRAGSLASAMLSCIDAQWSTGKPAANAAEVSHLITTFCPWLAFVLRAVHIHPY